MKKLATHPNPHLDDACGIWLLQRFHPAFKNASVKFIPQGKDKAASAYTAIGIGRGKYDEHKGDIFECATTLVYKDIREKIKNKLDRAALDEIVEWVKDEDHAAFLGETHHEYGVAITGMSIPKNANSKAKTSLNWMLTALDGIFVTVREKQELLIDWKKKKTFKTKWGRGVAIKTKVSSQQVAQLSMQKGYVIFAVVNPENGYRYIKSAVRKAKVNLSKAYKKAVGQEPQAEWYLHHSKRMLICGSDVAENKKLSKMSLDKLINLL